MDVQSPQVLEKVLEKIANIPREFRDRPDAEWTSAVLTRVAALGESLGYGVSLRSAGGGGGGEWLWDLVWLNRTVRGRLQSIPLVLECEWVYGGRLKRDVALWAFDKLLAANAQLAIFVLWKVGQPQLKELITECRSRAAEMAGAGTVVVLGSHSRSLVFEPTILR